MGWKDDFDNGNNCGDDKKKFEEAWNDKLKMAIENIKDGFTKYFLKTGLLLIKKSQMMLLVNL